MGNILEMLIKCRFGDGLRQDFRHLAENLHQCRGEVFGRDDVADQTWRPTCCISSSMQATPRRGKPCWHGELA